MPGQTSNWFYILCAACLIAGFNLNAFAAEEAESEQSAAAEETDQQTYRLSYQFEKGEFVKYQVHDRSVYTTRKNEIAETVRNESQQWRHYRVVSVDENNEATLELMIDRVRMMAQFDDSSPTLFDSANPDLQPAKMQSIMDSINVPLCRMRVNNRGEMVHVQGLQANTDTKNDPAINFLVVFPDRDITIGDTWNQTLEVEVPVTDSLKEKVKLIRKYTLKGVEGDVATIHVSTALATLMRDPAVQTRLMQMTPSGSIAFDMKRGVMLSRQQNVNDQVVGAFGSGTLVKAQSHRVEKLIEQKDPVAEAEKVSQK